LKPFGVWLPAGLIFLAQVIFEFQVAEME